MEKTIQRKRVSHGKRIKTPQEIAALMRGLREHDFNVPQITAEEKLARNVADIQLRLAQEPGLLLLLQPSPPGNMALAKCRAATCPLTDAEGGARIREAYRIALVSHDRQYFHVGCLQKLVDLRALAPARFKLDGAYYAWFSGAYTWSLMLRKWVEHSGRIDLGKIAAYIDAYDAYKESGEYSQGYMKWHHNHKAKCTTAKIKTEDEADGDAEDKAKGDAGDESKSEVCGCPAKPQSPVPPILKKYKTRALEACSLGDVLEHAYVERLSTLIVVQRFGMNYFEVPELESKVG